MMPYSGPAMCSVSNPVYIIPIVAMGYGFRILLHLPKTAIWNI